MSKTLLRPNVATQQDVPDSGQVDDFEDDDSDRNSEASTQHCSTAKSVPPRKASATSLDIVPMSFNSRKWLFEYFSVVLVVLSMSLSTALTMPAVRDWAHNSSANVIIHALEVCFGVSFAVEYCIRAFSAHRRSKFWSYICSFDGGVDAMAALSIWGDVDVMLTDPSRRHLNWFWLLRVFRVLKFMRYLKEMNTIAAAVAAEKKAMLVFMTYVFLLAFIFGTLLFYLEEDDDGFYSIPVAVWCVIVTVTTVGYGDTVPQSPLGRILITFVMLIGYSTLAVPTIVGVMDVFGHPEGSKDEDALEQHELVFSREHSENDSEEYPYWTRFQIRPWDCDRFGYLESAAYHHLFEAAITTFFSEKALWHPGRMEAVTPVVIRSSCDVTTPISAMAAGGEVVVGLAAMGMGETQCVFRIGIFSELGGPSCVQGFLKQMWVSTSPAEQLRPRCIPADIRQAISGVLDKEQSSETSEDNRHIARRLTFHAR